MEFTLIEDKSLGSQANQSQEESLVKPYWFFVCFVGYMDMYSDLQTVADYLNDHAGWFCRCAQPMKVEPLNSNGYILNIGNFASLGYEVQPKIAIVIDPPQDNLYVMRTVPVPNYHPPGYEVQYKSLMELSEFSADNWQFQPKKAIFQGKKSIPPIITRVSWQLDLAVTVEFPKFIYKLPSSLIQTTGDRFLAQIVRQISPRLSYKVQQDFHLAHELPMPNKHGRGLTKIEKESSFAVSSYESTINNSDRVA